MFWNNKQLRFSSILEDHVVSTVRVLLEQDSKQRLKIHLD